jgi:hypothetical protein
MIKVDGFGRVTTYWKPRDERLQELLMELPEAPAQEIAVALLDLEDARTNDIRVIQELKEERTILQRELEQERWILEEEIAELKAKVHRLTALGGLLNYRSQNDD